MVGKNTARKARLRVQLRLSSFCSYVYKLLKPTSF